MISTAGLSLKALKKEPYSGSFCGMRYYLCLSCDALLAYTYPEPWCFEATPDADKTRASFPVSAEGLEQAIAWIQHEYDSNRQRFTRSSQDKFKRMLDEKPSSR